MASSGRAGADALAALAASPWLWAGLSGLFLGCAGGWLLRWILAKAKGEARRAARRSALALLSLALALAAGAALLVLPPKAGLADVGLAWWAGALFVPGFAAVAWPRIGLPAGLVLCAAGAALVLDAGRGWIALDGPAAVARLTPFAKEGGSWKGELILYERDSLPTTFAVSFAGDRAALVVERLDLEGPAGLLGPRHSYRVVGLADGDSAQAAFTARFASRTSLLGRIEPLPESPVAGPVGSLVRRTRIASAALPLGALEPGYYSFVEPSPAGAEPGQASPGQVPTMQAGTVPAGAGLALESSTGP